MNWFAVTVFFVSSAFAQDGFPSISSDLPWGSPEFLGSLDEVVAPSLEGFAPPCDHCPHDSARFITGFHGVIVLNPGSSYVHIVFAGQKHFAWLVQKQSTDPRYLLFEQWEVPETKVKNHWAVEKGRTCGCQGHHVWHRTVDARSDEENWLRWKFVHCGQLTCVDTDAIPYPPDLVPKPTASISPRNGTAPLPGAEPKIGVEPNRPKDGPFRARSPASEKQKSKVTEPAQPERAPDAREEVAPAR